MSVKTYKLHGSYSTVPGGSLHDANKTIEVELDDKDYWYLNRNDAARNKYFQDHVIHATKVFSTSFEHGLFGQAKSVNKAENSSSGNNRMFMKTNNADTSKLAKMIAKEEAKSAERAAKAEAEGMVKLAKTESENRIKEMERQQELDEKTAFQNKISEIQSFQFDSKDVDQNIAFLLPLFSIIESTYDSPDKRELFDSAKSKLEIGVNLCKSMAPSNPSVIMLSEQYTQKMAEIKKKKTKSNILYIIGIVGLPLLLYLLLHSR